MADMTKHTFRQGPIRDKESMRGMTAGERFRRQEAARMKGQSQVQMTDACDLGPCEKPAADEIHAMLPERKGSK